MSESTVKYFPLDFDNLKKGDEIKTEQIEEFGRCRVSDEKKFRFAAMQLCKRIERGCRERGKLLRARCVKNLIRLLTDEEAAIFDYNNFKKGFKKQVRSLRRLLEVNTSNLTEQHQKEHERNICVSSKMVQAARSARAVARAVPYQRSTPGLPASSN